MTQAVQTKSIRQLVGEEIDALNQAGTKTSPSAVAERVVKANPLAMAEEGGRLARQRVTALARELLTDRAKGEQLQLEGIEIPRWITTPDGDGGFVHIPLRVVTKGEYRSHVNRVLKPNADAAQDEYRKHRRQLARLDKAEPSDVAKVIDIIRLLA